MASHPSSPDQAILEGFFGAKFESDSDNPLKEAVFFDGAIFWNLWLNEEEKRLYFRADTQELPSVFPILEVGIIYAEFKVDVLHGMGDILDIVHPKSELGLTPLRVTKTRGGRFSLATSIGDPFIATTS